ncbi:MAG: AAA family ATPase, partial [Bacteroidales bacterium]|nr:AAA family ATPase [Bacteroidales bacterium]
MEEILIGRDYESGLLEKYIASEKSEFIAVYGRRRVGKTFFIRKVLENRMCFAVSGVANVGINDQLTNFYLSMRQYFPKTVRQNSWLEAFDELRRQLEKSSLKTKILFIDEMPWLDTARSGFIAALEHFWNSWGSAQKNVKMIVCGSATSWMIDNLINSRGGLHNRVTHQICIEPFTLDQCKEYFKTYKFAFGIREITDCYMV